MGAENTQEEYRDAIGEERILVELGTGLCMLLMAGDLWGLKTKQEA